MIPQRRIRRLLGTEGHMRRRSKLYLLALGCLLGVTSNLVADGGAFTAIDFPGAAYTLVNGISPHGDVIGEYAATLTGSGPHHGFLLSKDGVFTTIDYPGATYTYALGMNTRGDVLGSYAFEDNLLHTFVLSADPFSPGGRFSAIHAASIGSVPDPHMGSANGRSPRQPLRSTSAAASASLSGAFVRIGRYPRLCSDAPELSRLSTAWSL